MAKTPDKIYGLEDLAVPLEMIFDLYLNHLVEVSFDASDLEELVNLTEFISTCFNYFQTFPLITTKTKHDFSTIYF